MNQEGHIDKYQYPMENYDHLIYTGFGYKGRTPVLVRSCEAVIALSGGIGTLNELTIAYDERKVIGLLREHNEVLMEFAEALDFHSTSLAYRAKKGMTKVFESLLINLGVIRIAFGKRVKRGECDDRIA